MAISYRAATNTAIQKEVDAIQRKLEALLKDFDVKERRKILNPAANILVESARSKVKDYKYVKKQYNTAKLIKSMKAPPGFGNVVAEYHPGNLKRSLRKLYFRKSKSAVFVGPKLKKGDKSGDFKGNKVDGYYAHFVEFGTVHSEPHPFMKPAYMETKNRIIEKIFDGVKRKVKTFAQKNKIT